LPEAPSGFFKRIAPRLSIRFAAIRASRVLNTV
jgi:hypothetical protein